MVEPICLGFAVVLFVAWLTAEARYGARARIALGLSCMGFAAFAWFFAELRMANLDAHRQTCFREIRFFLEEVGDIEKVKRRIAVYGAPGPEHLRLLSMWDEEDKIAKQIRELGCFVTPCDRLDQIACLYVSFSDREITDTVLERLGKFPRIGSLIFSDTSIDNAGLERLKGLTQLQHLDLQNTKITDLGLQHLKGMTRLTLLDLEGTSITDAGLEHLKGLTQLEMLRLVGTKATDQGVKKLQQLLPKCEIAK